MKKHFSTFLVLVLSVFLITSCKDKVPDGDNDPKDETPLDIGDFLPTKEGSWWLYNSTLPDQYLRKSTGKDTLKSGLMFKLFTYEAVSVGDKDAEYFGKFDGKDYYTLFTFDSVDANFFKVIILRDSCKVGDTWTNTGKMPYTAAGISGEVDIIVKCEIQSITDTYSMTDTTFNNVIKMHAKLSGTTAILPSTIDCGSVTYYFAKGIGVVRQEFDIKISLLGIKLFEKKHTETLFDYHIEK